MHAAPHAAPAACENCSTALQGGYCHVCGQHAVNPMRHFAHAVEEVFESFWHLDGRVFRTLRDLFVPGRVACNYLAGQRVRYIAPLRLFLILTVLTFFVGQLAVGSGEPAKGKDAQKPATSAIRVEADGAEGASSFKNATTEAEVQAALARQLADLEKVREAARPVPFMADGLLQAEREVRQLADRRIAELRRAGTPGAAPAAATSAPVDTASAASTAAPATAPTASTASTTSSATPPAATAAERQARKDAATRRNLREIAETFGTLRDGKAPWHEIDNPVDVGALPPFGDRWFNHRLANLERNVDRVNQEGETTMLRLALAAVPPALFVLVPLFALLLRVLYLLTPRGYLEHLVVALYSHAFMLMVLLLTFAMILLRAVVADGGAIATGSNVLQGLAWASLPVYLLVMQRRVYRQGWLATLGKYFLLGFAYFMLVMGMVVYSVLAGITSGA